MVLNVPLIAFCIDLSAAKWQPVAFMFLIAIPIVTTILVEAGTEL